MSETLQMKQQGEQTRKAILQAGLRLWPDVNASNIAKDIGVTHATVLYHFNNVKEAVAEYAITIGYSPVIVQMLATNHHLVKDMNGEERLKHFAAISGD